MVSAARLRCVYLVTLYSNLNDGFPVTLIERVHLDRPAPNAMDILEHLAGILAIESTSVRDGVVLEIQGAVGL